MNYPIYDERMVKLLSVEEERYWEQNPEMADFSNFIFCLKQWADPKSFEGRTLSFILRNGTKNLTPEQAKMLEDLVQHYENLKCSYPGCEEGPSLGDIGLFVERNGELCDKHFFMTERSGEKFYDEDEDMYYYTGMDDY